MSFDRVEQFNKRVEPFLHEAAGSPYLKFSAKLQELKDALNKLTAQVGSIDFKSKEQEEMNMARAFLDKIQRAMKIHREAYELLISTDFGKAERSVKTQLSAVLTSSHSVFAELAKLHGKDELVPGSVEYQHQSSSKKIEKEPVSPATSPKSPVGGLARLFANRKPGAETIGAKTRIPQDYDDDRKFDDVVERQEQAFGAAAAARLMTPRVEEDEFGVTDDAPTSSPKQKVSPVAVYKEDVKAERGRIMAAIDSYNSINIDGMKQCLADFKKKVEEYFQNLMKRLENPKVNPMLEIDIKDFKERNQRAESFLKMLQQVAEWKIIKGSIGSVETDISKAIKKLTANRGKLNVDSAFVEVYDAVRSVDRLNSNKILKNMLNTNRDQYTRCQASLEAKRKEEAGEVSEEDIRAYRAGRRRV